MDTKEPAEDSTQTGDPSPFRVSTPVESLASIYFEQGRLADSITQMISKVNFTNIVDATAISAGLAAQSPEWFSTIHAALPRIDVSAFSGMAEISKSLSRQNTLWLSSIQPALPKLEMPDLAQFIAPAWFEGIHEIVHSQISGILSGLDWGQLRRRTTVPSNWPPEFESHLPMIQRMLQEEGLPLAWVPRPELFLQLLSAASSEERLAILRQNRVEVLEDCAKIIEDLDDEFLAAQIPLAREVITACQEGLWSVGAVCAVAIVHSIVENLEWSTNHQGLVKHHGFAGHSTLDELIEGATRAPFVSFYTEWHPKSGQPQPRGLSRNIIAHQVTDAHLGDHNCLIAVMLMASLMETVYQLKLGRPSEEAA